MRYNIRANSRNFRYTDVGEALHAHNAEERGRILRGSQSLATAMLYHFKLRAKDRGCTLHEAAYHCGMRP